MWGIFEAMHISQEKQNKKTFSPIENTFWRNKTQRRFLQAIINPLRAVLIYGRWAVQCRYFCRAATRTEWIAVLNPSAGNQRFCNYVYMYMSALLCNIYAQCMCTCTHVHAHVCTMWLYTSLAYLSVCGYTRQPAQWHLSSCGYSLSTIPKGLNQSQQHFYFQKTFKFTLFSKIFTGHGMAFSRRVMEHLVRSSKFADMTYHEFLVDWQLCP